MIVMPPPRVPVDRRILRELTCVHEAGHTTAGLVLGLAFVKVKYTSDTSGVVITKDVPEGMELPEAICYAAGLAAELRALQHIAPEGQYDQLYDAAWAAAEHDTYWVRRYAQKAGVAVGRVRADAGHLVDRNMAAIRRTARVLISARIMNERRVRAVAGRVR